METDVCIHNITNTEIMTIFNIYAKNGMFLLQNQWGCQRAKKTSVLMVTIPMFNMFNIICALIRDD